MLSAVQGHWPWSRRDTPKGPTSNTDVNATCDERDRRQAREQRPSDAAPCRVTRRTNGDPPRAGSGGSRGAAELCQRLGIQRFFCGLDRQVRHQLHRPGQRSHSPADQPGGDRRGRCSDGELHPARQLRLPEAALRTGLRAHPLTGPIAVPLRVRRPSIRNWPPLDCVGRAHVDRPDLAILGRRHLGLHLHGGHYQQRVAGAHVGVCLNQHRDNSAGCRQTCCPP
jgi:hypothetical protein